MKRNLDFYSEKRRKALDMFRNGFSVSEISSSLGVPYSTVYGWINRQGSRRTQSERFYEFVLNNGPVTIEEAKKHFPKHSDIFLKAVARGFPIRKFDSGIRGKFRHWYFVDSQKQKLLSMVRSLAESLDKARESIRDRI